MHLRRRAERKPCSTALSRLGYRSYTFYRLEFLQIKRLYEIGSPLKVANYCRVVSAKFERVLVQ